MPVLTKKTALKAAKRAIFILLALSIVINMNATAQELEFVGSCPTSDGAYAVCVSGDFAYIVNRNQGLQIIGISDRANPVLVGSYDTPWDATDVSVEGELAYLVGYGGLAIIEIADPSEPAIVGSYGTEVATSVFVARHYAYLADWDLGVYVVDIADPANPILVTIYDTPHAAADIMVVGDYVYVADYDSFIILRFVNVPCQGTYIPGDCNSNGYPLQLADVTAMIGLYRGSIMPGYTCNCSPHGNFFAPQADPNGNCMAYELVDVVTEIAAYRGLGTVSGCPDCPPME